MNSTPILVQPDIVTFSPYRKFRSLCIGGAIALVSGTCFLVQRTRHNRSGASEREPGPEDFDRIEGEFRIEAALNVAGLAEAMLLAREQEIADRIAFAP
jgi:hypothetical protein